MYINKYVYFLIPSMTFTAGKQTKDKHNTKH